MQAFLDFYRQFARYLLFLLAFSACGKRESIVKLSSSGAHLSFDLDRGAYHVVGLSGDTLVRDAFLKVDGWRSTQTGVTFEAELRPVSRFGKSGTALEVKCKSDTLHVRWTAIAFEDSPFFIQQMAVQNRSADTIWLKEWSPLAHGLLHPGKAMKNARMLDGNGGGESTRVSDAGYMRSRNNLLFTFDDAGGRRCSFVAGGVRYADFEKHARLETDQVREAVVKASSQAAGTSLIAYLDLGEDTHRFDSRGTGLMVQQGWPYLFTTSAIREIGTTIYADKRLILTAENIDPQKVYSLGFSWMDEGDARVQGVYVDGGEGTPRYDLLTHASLPVVTAGDDPQQVVVRIPRAASASGSFRIVVEAERGPNAVLSEAWLNEGWPAETVVRTDVAYAEPRWFAISTFARDPVGMRIDPGDWYSPDDDLFYLDAVTPDPFDALELYGRALKQFQEVDTLPYYTFPTVCLWYASHRHYGGGPSVNDTPGAVAEMDRAVDSGITRFSPVAIRLVPDHYGINNEQGWWDDEHWQRYGSGDDNPNSVVVEGAHYKPPYATTAQWAKAILDRGGIPLTYVQTARRSQDFCDAFPEYMLFNESNHAIPDSNWLTLGKSSYDFTDTGFIKHMQGVYRNLKDGGVKGMMFDYTSTAWADYGGMEDKYSTAAAMYRNVFQLAHDGLGGNPWIHERNLERGTDLTLGLVASQRVWGDTDGITDEMVSRTGLRWYKNRVVINYDMDSKNTEKLRNKSRDFLRQMLTMSYVASGRLLLGNSFARMTAEDLHDLSRVLPFHSTAQSARPIDAFLRVWPTIYHFKVSDAWHQVTLYNTSDAEPADFNVSLAAPNYRGGLSLDQKRQYHCYDFWNEAYLGQISGADTLVQQLRPAEARMISIRAVESHPQVISTNRHLMQGYLDLHSLRWDAAARSYSGIADVVAGDPYRMTIALNGSTVDRCSVNSGTCKVIASEGGNDAVVVEIRSDVSAAINWALKVK